MKIAFICVCYNAYDHLLNYMSSVFSALESCSVVKLDFVVVDNSDDIKQEEVKRIHEKFPSVRYIKSENVGYFPGLKKGLDSINKIDEYEYVVVSNVDLVLSNDFFRSLLLCDPVLSESVGVIAPSILSRKRKADLNPKTILRPSKLSHYKNIWIFKNRFVLGFYWKLSNWKAYVKSKNNKYRDGDSFYSPHGSFIVFTKHYFKKGGGLDYPMFLFGEEDYVAEECLKLQLKVVYLPRLVVFDEDHGSTSKEKIDFLAREHVKSIKYILDTYYER